MEKLPVKDFSFDTIIVGAGVIGLAVADELARHGQKVCVVTKKEQGKQASWAGAGIIPPPIRSQEAHPAEKLRAFSTDLHPIWHERLLKETGIDSGLTKCGGVHLARSTSESAMLFADLEMMEHEQIDASMIDLDDLIEREPGLTAAVKSGLIKAALYQPDEWQIRNPRFLKSLRQSCCNRSVMFIENRTEIHFQSNGKSGIAHSNPSRIAGIDVNNDTLSAKNFVVAAGAWTNQILRQFDFELPVLPMRGQMLMFELESPPFRSIINTGSRYIACRPDGKVLAGSCEEESGFENVTTEEMRDDLLQFAGSISPRLSRESLVDHWSGLRPATLDRYPYLGKVHPFGNMFVAAGHFRGGITNAPGTAHVIREMILLQESTIDVSSLGVQRGIG